MKVMNLEIKWSCLVGVQNSQVKEYWTDLDKQPELQKPEILEKIEV